MMAEMSRLLDEYGLQTSGPGESGQGEGGGAEADTDSSSAEVTA